MAELLIVSVFLLILGIGDWIIDRPRKHKKADPS